jgi:hypothetical protein
MEHLIQGAEETCSVGTRGISFGVKATNLYKIGHSCHSLISKHKKNIHIPKGGIFQTSCHKSHIYQGKINAVSDDKPNWNHIHMDLQKPNFTVQWTELLCRFKVSTVQISVKKLRCVMVISYPFRQYSTVTLLQMHPSTSFH